MRDRFSTLDDDGRHCRGRRQRRSFRCPSRHIGASVRAATALKTPWGEPDLQGIWTDETDTPLQRPPRYANQEFFTEEQRAELDKQRSRAAGPRQARGARHRARRRRRLQRGVRVREAHRRAHVADRRSAQWPDSAADAGGAEDRGRRAGIPPRPAAIDRDLQEQVGRLQRRQVRSEALAAARRASAALQHRAHESLRQSGGRRACRIAA